MGQSRNEDILENMLGASNAGINNIFCDTGDTSLQFRKIQSAS